jgi:tetratricopeptide (TPR) repeat protein
VEDLVMEKNMYRKEYISILLPFAITMLIVFIFTVPIFSSDLSDATALREKCERELKIIEVSVKNFGDSADLQTFSNGEKLVKLGRLKFAQTKYPEAIENYNNYLKLQHNLYGSLAKKYTERTAKLIDEIAEDLVDYIDNRKVEEYIRLANQNLRDARSTMTNKHYTSSIDHCRLAKNYAFGTYKLVGKDIPKRYDKDVADNEKRIHK